MAKILVIDDEIRILKLIQKALQIDSHTITLKSNPEKIDFKNLKKYDLILLDIMMPEIDGFTLCKKIRTVFDNPIIFLTAKTMENDIIYGLNIGADDYITKPFGVNELRARIKAHLRRETREKNYTIQNNGLCFDLLGKEILINNKKIPFTKSEYYICEFLSKNKGQVFSKEQIYEKIYGYEGESELSTIAEHIKNIRAKLKKFKIDPIETVWGIGYKWKKEQ
ncbi:MAG: two-component system, OmpR family, lantibiotic biosynthesis response regulator NisR/SpaR [Oceanotoga sp.]|jgi:DNA-binding response OmpR family regulator|uniref:response regulator transcription factor n=1 Tax=Oceanotoga sp. TaxID=2108366 RepID=UPI00264EFD65|nr:response regulator transcription factor [Oceanotoga sp.]MDN5341430.1 two-component system, OmpR family, lantibiotic biosynthesis response regulator NisR/SpaR [Oceanotoga sp.]